jgi:hypothetical protein
VQGVSIVHLEASVDLFKDLVERLIENNEPERTNLKAAYQSATKEKHCHSSTNPSLHKNQRVFTTYALFGYLPYDIAAVSRSVLVLKLIVLLSLQALLLDHTLAVCHPHIYG